MGFIKELWKYLEVFLYLLTPSQIYDFWSEPHNTDELYDYYLPENGWICLFCSTLYWIIESMLDVIIYCIASVIQLDKIANDEFYN